MSRRSMIWLIALALHVVGAVGVASAQTQLGGWNLEGEAEFGGRWDLDRPPPRARAQLEERRDTTPRPLLFGLNLPPAAARREHLRRVRRLEVGLLGPGLLPVGRQPRDLAV